MTKADLVEQVAEAIGPGITKKDCALVVDGFLNAIKLALAEGENMLQPPAVERWAWLWVQYSLFLQRMAAGDSLVDTATVLEAMWPEVLIGTVDNNAILNHVQFVLGLVDNDVGIGCSGLALTEIPGEAEGEPGIAQIANGIQILVELKDA